MLKPCSACCWMISVSPTPRHPAVRHSRNPASCCVRPTKSSAVPTPPLSTLPCGRGLGLALRTSLLAQSSLLGRSTTADIITADGLATRHKPDVTRHASSVRSREGVKTRVYILLVYRPHLFAPPGPLCWPLRPRLEKGVSGEVELGLVPVMLTRRLGVGQRRIHLAHEAPRVLALALARIDVSCSLPALVLAVPADTCSPTPRLF
jgi:hypothetical protein